MDEEKKARLLAGGVNLQSALDRFMNNEKMLERYFDKFLNEKTYAELLKAIDEDDRETAQRAAHSLKSVCGTLGFEAMSRLVIDQEAKMRAGDWDGAVAMLPDIKNAYQSICALLAG